jgi:hypothetical protein
MWKARAIWFAIGHFRVRRAGPRPLSASHARWFHGHASTLTDRLLIQALLASGATQDEAERFARSLLERIHRLHAVVTSPAGQP